VTKRTARANIASLFIEVYELPQRLDNIDVLARPRHNQLAALVQAVIQDLQALEHVPPVLALVVEALVEHVHDLVEVGAAVVGDAGDVGHVGARGAPWVIGGSWQALSVVMLWRRQRRALVVVG
jgi:hypothetical protein